MTTEEIDEIIAPSAEARDLVFEWLREKGLGDSAALNWRGNVILVDTTVDKAEALLHADYKSYGKRTLVSNSLRNQTY
jgi:hypothetical protein